MQRLRGSSILRHVVTDASWATDSVWNIRVALVPEKICKQDSYAQAHWIYNRRDSGIDHFGSWSPTQNRLRADADAHPKPQYSRLVSYLNCQFSSYSRRLSSLTVTAAPKTEDFGESSSLTTPRDVARFLRHYGRCYWELSKARLSLLVTTTAGAGFIMGSGTDIDYWGLSWTCLGTLLVAAAANTINQILEAENDSCMRRTNRRPLPTGRITVRHAMAWAAAASVGGITLLGSQTNMIAAGLGAVNLILYTLVYTPLKQIHSVNTWVGSVVGAVPPLLGCAAAAGEVSMGGWILASSLYFWQIPHFMAIAYLCRQDYAVAGFKMLSMQDNAGKRTALVAMRNCVYLLPLGFLAHHCGETTLWFGLEMALFSAAMGTSAAVFYLKPNADSARKLFRASLLYLPVLMFAMLCHRCPKDQGNKRTEECSTKTSFNTHVMSESDEGVAQVLHQADGPRKSLQPPVASLCVAPFPFLPAPDYASS